MSVEVCATLQATLSSFHSEQNQGSADRKGIELLFRLDGSCVSIHISGSLLTAFSCYFRNNSKQIGLFLRKSF